ncbi:MAG: virulence factor [Chloroflexota bacterium]
MPQYQILYWHDIPVQVRVKKGRKRLSKPLPNRFQEAVDKAAMRAKHASGDDYTDGYIWGDAQERDGEPQAILEDVIAELDAQYAEIDWRGTAAKVKAAAANDKPD